LKLGLSWRWQRKRLQADAKQFLDSAHRHVRKGCRLERRVTPANLQKNASRIWSRDISVDIVTRHGLDVQGIVLRIPSGAKQLPRPLRSVQPSSHANRSGLLLRSYSNQVGINGAATPLAFMLCTKVLPPSLLCNPCSLERP
jgi:hypothetical protein